MASNAHILQSIGKTALVELRRAVPAGAAQIFAKLEWQLGSKARIATLMIDSGLKYLSTDVYPSGPES